MPSTSKAGADDHYGIVRVIILMGNTPLPTLNHVRDIRTASAAVGNLHRIKPSIVSNASNIIFCKAQVPGSNTCATGSMPIGIHRIRVIVTAVMPANDFGVGKTTVPKHGVGIINSRITDGDGQPRAVVAAPDRGGVHEGNALGQVGSKQEVFLYGYDVRALQKILQPLFRHLGGKTVYI